MYAYILACVSVKSTIHGRAFCPPDCNIDFYMPESNDSITKGTIFYERGRRTKPGSRIPAI